MKYTALLKGVAHQLGYEIVWSPPQLVNGSINPPPSLRYPGLTCYMAQVRVGPREFSGFGPTAVSATHIAESKAYVELYFHLREKRTNSRGDCYQRSSSAGDGASETSTREQRETGAPPGEASDEERRVLRRFARECNEYFKSVKRDGPTGTPVPSTRDGVLPSKQRGVACSGAHSWKRAGVGHRGGHGVVAGLDSSEESCSVFSSSEEGEEEEERDEEVEGKEEEEEEEGDVTPLVSAFQRLKLTGGGPRTEFVDSSHPELDTSSGDTSVPFANAIEENSDGADTKSENSDVSKTFSVQNIDSSTISVQNIVISALNSDSESGTVTLNTVPNVSDNPIGQLQELFMQESGPLPTYQFSADGVKDKNRPTVFHCVVHVYGFQGKGQGYRKTKAKKSAAANMLSEMQKVGINITPRDKASKKAHKQQKLPTTPASTTNSLPPPIPLPPPISHPSPLPPLQDCVSLTPHKIPLVETVTDPKTTNHRPGLPPRCPSGPGLPSSGPELSPCHPAGLRLPPHCPSGPRLPPHCPSGPRLRPYCPSGPRLPPHCPIGPRLRPHCPSGPRLRPHCPSGPRLRPHCPGGPRLSPHCPGGPRLHPHCPSGPRLPPHSPGGPRLPPHSPGGPRFPPHCPSGQRFSPRSPSDARFSPRFPTDPRLPLRCPTSRPNLQSDITQQIPATLIPPVLRKQRNLLYPSVSSVISESDSEFSTESDIGCCGGNVAFNERGSLIQLDPTGGHSGPRCSGCSSMPADRKEGDRLSLRKKWTPDLLPKPVQSSRWSALAHSLPTHPLVLMMQRKNHHATASSFSPDGDEEEEGKGEEGEGEGEEEEQNTDWEVFEMAALPDQGPPLYSFN